MIAAGVFTSLLAATVAVVVGDMVDERFGAARPRFSAILGLETLVAGLCWTAGV